MTEVTLLENMPDIDQRTHPQKNQRIEKLINEFARLMDYTANCGTTGINKIFQTLHDHKGRIGIKTAAGAQAKC